MRARTAEAKPRQKHTRNFRGRNKTEENNDVRMVRTRHSLANRPPADIYCTLFSTMRHAKSRSHKVPWRSTNSMHLLCVNAALVHTVCLSSRFSFLRFPLSRCPDEKPSTPLPKKLEVVLWLIHSSAACSPQAAVVFLPKS